ncbi:MAG: AMP-binding protein [Acidobacteriota bacterium]|nr:AMP-binding protein [Acidobacteriota bacterium]
MTRTTVLSYLDDYARRGESVAFSYRRGLRVYRWSYARLAANAYKFARELEARRIGRGERVLLCGENSPAWVAALFGCLLRGAIIVPLDRESAPEFIARVRQQTEAKLLLYGDDISDDVRSKFDADLPGLRLEELEHAVAHHSPEPYPLEDIDEEAIAEIIYTSGTTSEPKGVVLTHRNLLANLLPLEQEIQKYLKWERLVHPVRFLNLVPLSHVFGQMMGIFVPQLLGGEVFFGESLKPSEIISTTRRERISCIVLVPRMLDGLRDAVERRSSAEGKAEEFQRALTAAGGWHPLRRWWRFRDAHRWFGWKFWAFVSGGATLAAETEEFWQRLGFAVLQGYGMTETASLISVNHPFKRSRGSIGKTLPAQEVCLDESGEIMVRGANVSPGYWAGDAQPLRNEEEWLRTGDIGERDAQGNLYFRGRKKDVIVTSAGVNIYPEDLEAALNRQPEVRASVVVPVERARGTEPCAVLIMRDERMSPATAIERANASLSQHQQIRRWFIWTERDFPRTPTQKVRKREVLERMKTESATMRAEDVKSESSNHKSAFIPSPSTSILSLIRRISGDAQHEQIDPSAKLATDLKLDSLGRVELLSALEERYQIEIDEAAFNSATTLGDIEKIVNEESSDATTQYPYPEWAQARPTTWIRLVALYLLILPITRLMCPAKVSGKKHLDALREPVLFVANHVTLADQALILSALPGRFRRRLAIAMDGELLRDWRHAPPGTAWFTRLRFLVQYALVVSFFNVFPLPKQSGFRRSFTYAGESMDRGYHLLVFPEGKRTEDGQMNRFMTGAGLLAKNLDAPVVPVKLMGLFELKRRRRYFAPAGQVAVTFGAPVRFVAKEEPAHITRELEQCVAALEP